MVQPLFMTSTLPQRALIGTDGQPRYGHFSTPITDLALDKFDYRNVMDKPASSLTRYLHYKQFQFVSISHNDWQIGIALADIRYLTSAFCYFYDRKTGLLEEVNLLKPLSLGVSMSDSPVCGTARVTGKQNIAITPDGFDWNLTLSGTLLNGELTLHGNQTVTQPLALCTPTGYNGWTYTQKHNALAISGELRYDNKALDLTQALAGYDFSAGYMRRETSWRWASISALVTQGTFGLNLANGVNETGFTENCLWLNGAKQLLPAVTVQLDRQNRNANWTIQSADDKINLTFKPAKVREEKLNIIVLASNFRQYCGSFSGVIQLNDGNSIALDNVPGLAEDHFARW